MHTPPAQMQPHAGRASPGKQTLQRRCTRRHRSRRRCCPAWDALATGEGARVDHFQINIQFKVHTFYQIHSMTGILLRKTARGWSSCPKGPVKPTVSRGDTRVRFSHDPLRLWKMHKRLRGTEENKQWISQYIHSGGSLFFLKASLSVFFLLSAKLNSTP